MVMGDIKELASFEIKPEICFKLIKCSLCFCQFCNTLSFVPNENVQDFIDSKKLPFIEIVSNQNNKSLRFSIE